VVSDGSTVVLLCYAAEDNLRLPQPQPQSRSSAAGRAFRVLEFRFTFCSSFKFGAPNDETLPGHPLFDSGITYYATHKIHNSPWVTELEALRASHPGYRGPGITPGVHYLLSFQDETFEAVADAVQVNLIELNMADAMAGAGRSLAIAR
jgi:hypothetical protein